MKRHINIAVLGLGRLGYAHTKNLLTEVHGTNLIMVVDPMPGRAKEVANEFGIKHYSTLVDDALTHPDVEAVVIVTPTSTHAEIIKKATLYQKHIFVEKPLTLNFEESEEVSLAIRNADIICQVGFMRRFDPGYAEAKRRIENGEIGRPLYFKAFTRDPGSPPAEFIKHSGGIFVDCSIHDYDIARYLLNTKITAVSAHGHVLKHDFMKKLNDIDQGLTYVEFANGAIGDMEVSRNSPYGYDIRAEIIGTEGSLFVGSLREQQVTVLNQSGSSFKVFPDFQTRFRVAYIEELKHFIHCIQTGEIPLVNEQDATENLRIALAATHAYRTGKKVIMEEFTAENASLQQDKA
ncbi:Gfo/Idh/MocA family oxidoreductase [Shouchella sp. JSM 1781072]|uniref:Gfo/Idh/MocA family oxidoreductase n=1 Tax=Shouchella sp. JSM 1781072 TaxID=3344581 RepID=UPI0035BEC4C0